MMHWMFLREGKSVDDLDDMFVYLAIFSVIGARLGHCLFYNPDYYLSHPLEILKIWNGGLASHGGAIGVLLTGVVFVRRRPNYSFLWLLDRSCIPLALTASFIRLGNVFNSELVGIPATVPWAIIFQRVDWVPRHPVQLYESLAYAVIFVFLLSFYLKAKERLYRGLLFGMFLVLMFSARIALEFFKPKQAAFAADISFNMGQYLSVPFFAVGVVLILRAWSLKTIE